MQRWKKMSTRLLLLGLIFLCCFGVLLFYCVDPRFYSTAQLLPDILESEQRPTPSRSIFFIDTSFIEANHSAAVYAAHAHIAHLTPRQACAVESAALHNPNSQIFVLYANPTYWMGGTTDGIMNAILNYPNVNLRNMNLWRYAAETPIQDWFEKGEIFHSNFLIEHVADFFRLITMWRWGGIYLDTDVIVLRSLEIIPPNYLGVEADYAIGSAVMNFAHDGIGHKIADYCLNDFQRNFNGQLWTHNGPDVLARALQHFCQTDKIVQMVNSKHCKGFQVFSNKMFYAVHWSNWMSFFDPNQKNATLNSLKDSYVTHVWNKLSKNQKSSVEKPGAYVALAARHCPKVYALAAEYF